jgi:TIR domain-containing protein
MSSLADAPDLVGFFSYSREDDEGSGGRLSTLRERIQEELRGQLGRTKRDFRLWQDKVAIAHGELWEDTIKKGIAESVFFIPIITPTAVKSRFCKFEFETFLAREKELDRSNLVFPILYIPVPALTDDRRHQDPLLAIIGSRQYEQWQNLRHLDPSSTEVALRIEKFCANICRALQQEWLSPEERREAEAQRVAEAERRRQREAGIQQRADEEERRRKAEAEQRRRNEDERRQQEGVTRFDNPTLRLVEAEAENRRQDEERRTVETEAKLAAKEEQRRKELEQGPQQLVQPWLLPLIGAVAACLPPAIVVLGIVTGEAVTVVDLFKGLAFVFTASGFAVTMIIHALYGGAAGMLIRRFGILKAVAIPVIPALLLVLVFRAYWDFGRFGGRLSTNIDWWGGVRGLACGLPRARRDVHLVGILVLGS